MNAYHHEPHGYAPEMMEQEEAEHVAMLAHKFGVHNGGKRERAFARYFIVFTVGVGCGVALLAGWGWALWK